MKFVMTKMTLRTSVMIIYLKKQTGATFSCILESKLNESINKFELYHQKLTIS